MKRGIWQPSVRSHPLPPTHPLDPLVEMRNTSPRDETGKAAPRQKCVQLQPPPSPCAPPATTLKKNMDLISTGLYDTSGTLNCKTYCTQHGQFRLKEDTVM